MENLGFIIAGYGVILGGTALYVGLLLRRLAAARRVSLQIRREAESAAPPAPDRPA
jgi:tRNA A37 N6-isopentenylltransferase MiaA